MPLETKGSTLVSEGSPTSAIIIGIKENMFENLSNKFEEIFSSLKKAPSLNEAQVDDGLRKIRQALLEAEKSLEKSEVPVGAVIVVDQKIIGRGHTQRFKHNHAEIEAINSCNEDLKESTLFTTLEPCNLTLNTPPCTDQIIKSKIKHVVVGSKDINPKINGAGINELIKANIKTEMSKINKTINYSCRIGLRLQETYFIYFLLKVTT